MGHLLSSKRLPVQRNEWEAASMRGDRRPRIHLRGAVLEHHLRGAGGSARGAHGGQVQLRSAVVAQQLLRADGRVDSCGLRAPLASRPNP